MLGRGCVPQLRSSQGTHLLGLAKGAESQVQDGVRSRDGLNSDPGISCSLGSDTKAVR